MNKKLLHLGVFILFLPVISWAGMESDVIDQVEQQNENSKSTGKKKGTWLPVPIPVSNPTIGSGLQAALLYLHPKKI